MSDSLTAETVSIESSDGTEIETYLARPQHDRPRGGVVVIHHLPGYDRATKEIVRRFAELGYDTVCPNLYSRQAPGADPSDAAALVRSQGGIRDGQLVADVDGAVSYLRGLPTSIGRVGVIGYCSGGRHSVLAACRLNIDAAIDCYGAFVTGAPPPDHPLQVKNLVEELSHLGCPLLGLFGNDDKSPAVELVDEFDQRLAELGKAHTFHRYDGAGHAFFAVDRPSYRVAAANDGWDRIAEFFAAHLGESRED